ncbi:uncharacterized protein Hap1MRO34_012372 [Clarias gariepinus]|uniref:uncharacterized protein LOC128531431 n=1 Tax=Clarias gariepinus TaxID=13013 RepID=UPI00234CD639|nr:uncharacterized protein LOC128531431 [Clarias gariepinus]
MTGLWVFIFVFTTIFQSGRRWVTAQSTVLDIYQLDEVLSVDIGNSATLQCCVFGIKDEEIIWFKQQNGKQPQIILRFFKTAQTTFYNEFQNSQFQIKKFGNCYNLTILNTVLSDEARYYCALVFAAGTHLKIKGEHVTIASETSKPSNSVVCDKTLHRNSNNMNMQEKAVLILGSALGFSVLIIVCLAFFIMWKRIRGNESTGDLAGTMQEAETLNYAALQFSKRKVKAEKRRTGALDECVYSDVNKTKK